MQEIPGDYLAVDAKIRFDNGKLDEENKKRIGQKIEREKSPRKSKKRKLLNDDQQECF